MINRCTIFSHGLEFDLEYEGTTARIYNPNGDLQFIFEDIPDLKGARYAVICYAEYLQGIEEHVLRRLDS